MNTDIRPDLRAGGESKLLLRPETEKIIGFAFEVLNFKCACLQWERIVL